MSWRIGIGKDDEVPGGTSFGPGKDCGLYKRAGEAIDEFLSK